MILYSARVTLCVFSRGKGQFTATARQAIGLEAKDWRTLRATAWLERLDRAPAENGHTKGQNGWLPLCLLQAQSSKLSRVSGLVVQKGTISRVLLLHLCTLMKCLRSYNRFACHMLPAQGSRDSMKGSYWHTVIPILSNCCNSVSVDLPLLQEKKKEACLWNCKREREVRSDSVTSVEQAPCAGAPGWNKVKREPCL